MQKTTIAIAMSCTLFLIACGKSSDQEQKASDNTAAPVTEQSIPAQTSSGSMTDKAVEVGKQTWDQTKAVSSDVADTVTDKSQQLYEGAKETAVEAGTAVKEKAAEVGSAISEKSSEYYETAKEKSVEVIDATKEKGAEVIDSLKQ
jgi:aspartyl aminopeptidase